MQIPEEEVDNLCKTFDWISSSIKFWKLEKEYPTNLIKKVCDNFYDYLSDLLQIYRASTNLTPKS